MSAACHKTVSFSNFQSTLDAASKEYKRKTGQDLQTHPLAAELDHCNSPDGVLGILQKHADALDNTEQRDQTLMRWLSPTIHVLYMLSATIGGGVGLVFLHANVIFTGIGILLGVAKGVAASHGVLLELFERIQAFLTRLNIYSGIPLTMEMMTMHGNIMAEVLSVLALSTNEMQERRIKKFVKRLGGRTEVEDALQRLDKITQEETRMTAAKTLEVTHDIKETAENMNRSQSRERLKNWLSPQNPSVNHNIACGAHHDGTGSWLFRGSSFKEWKAGGSLLWVHGKPGSGKSILASAIIEDIRVMHKAGLASFAYFYFDFKDSSKRDIRNLLSSILAQLCDQSDQSWSILSQLYTNHRDGSDQPSEASLIKCLQDILNGQGQSATYIIVDAVDECPDSSGIPSPREKVLNLVEDLVNSHADLRICVTSRLEQDIRMVLEPLACQRISLQDETGQNDDIVDYVRFVVYSDRTMRRWRQEDKELVVRTLTERANGMFRWVFCQLEILRRCFPPSIRHLLDELPTTLNETYERILMEIPEEKWKHARRLFQCLVVSFRPLRVEELAEVLAFRFDADKTPHLVTSWRPENTEDAILSACSSLIALVKVDCSLVVQFAHFSVKEYLTSDRLAMAQARSVSRYHTPTSPAHQILAQACLSTLLELDEHIDKEGLKNYPLAFYAARHWFDHTRIQVGDASLSMLERVEQLFDPGKPHFSTWIWLYDVSRPWRMPSMEDISEHPLEPEATPLYYSAACGYPNLIERLIAIYPNDVNPREGGWAPMYVAVTMGHLDVARVLLEHGACVDFRTGDWTLLHFASSKPDLDAIQLLLLEHGADADCRDDLDQTPLHLASHVGCPKTMRQLLQHGADTNNRMLSSRTPLYQAVRSGNLEAVRLLLQYGANVNDKDDLSRTALHVSSSPEITLALLECGADVNARDKFGNRPLEIATEFGYHDIAQLLLKHCAREVIESNRGIQVVMAYGYLFPRPHIFVP